MRAFRLLSLTLAASAVIVTGGCSSTNRYAPQPIIPRAPAAAPPPAYLFGDVIGVRRDRARRIIASGARPLAPANVAAFIGRYENELRRETAGTGVDVIRHGYQLVVRMPAALTFPSGSADIKPEFRSTLDEVARIVSRHRQAYVDVLGHTDTTGSDAANQGLSQRRAISVRDYLVSRKVAAVRVATRGYGESMPLQMPELSETDQAANRRVEIRITPLLQGDR